MDRNVVAEYVQRVAQIESGGNRLALNRASSAAGLFQFTQPTWEALRRRHPELRLTSAGRLDADQATRAMIAFTLDNASFLRSRTGREPTLADLYLAHFLGPLGAMDLLLAAPDSPAGRALGKAAVRANPFLSNISVRGLRLWAAAHLLDTHPAPSFTNRSWNFDAQGNGVARKGKGIQDGPVEPGSALDRYLREGQLRP